MKRDLRKPTDGGGVRKEQNRKYKRERERRGRADRDAAVDQQITDGVVVLTVARSKRAPPSADYRRRPGPSRPSTCVHVSSSFALSPQSFINSTPSGCSLKSKLVSLSRSLPSLKWYRHNCNHAICLSCFLKVMRESKKRSTKRVNRVERGSDIGLVKFG